MAQVTSTHYSESQRMQLRGLIRLASDVVSYYWPMRTFVHHNPLHGLEVLRFEEAVQLANKTLGGQGYLSNAVFRDYVRTGRILPRHLDVVLKPLAQLRQIRLGIREITHLEVLRACLLGETVAPPPDTFDSQVARNPDRNTIMTLAGRFGPDATQSSTGELIIGHHVLGRNETLASCCDRVLGTQISETINREMVKWCAAFLDEGHAPWPMPRREHGFYAAWKFLAQREWAPGGIDNGRIKLARLPAEADDSLLQSIGVLGVDADAWQDYFSLHLAELSGWAGFIKWRADQSEYEWQASYPVDLVQYLAVRLWYERELV